MARSARHSAIILAAYVVAGAVAGLIWHQVWDAPTGVVAQGSWKVTSEDAYRTFFSATGWFVVLSAVFGLALGLVTGLLTRERELVALVTVAVASVVAAWVLWRTGLALSVPDPEVLARKAADGTMLEGRISVGSWSPFLAFPIASLFGLLIPFLTLPGRERVSAADTQGSSAR